MWHPGAHPPTHLHPTYTHPPNARVAAAAGLAMQVCHGTRRGDLTTKQNCCPSVIQAASTVCSFEQTAPCNMPGDAAPPSPQPLNLPGEMPAESSSSVFAPSVVAAGSVQQLQAEQQPSLASTVCSAGAVNGSMSSDGRVCCTLGCGQSRTQCMEKVRTHHRPSAAAIGRAHVPWLHACMRASPGKSQQPTASTTVHAPTRARVLRAYTGRRLPLICLL